MGTLRADEPAPANLISITRTVLARNPGLRAAGSNLDKAQGGLSEVRSMNWPKLSVRSSVLRGDNPVYVFGSLLEQQSFSAKNFAIDALNNPDNLTNFKNALVLEMPLFTGLELQSGAKMGKIQLEQARVGYESASQNIRLQTIEGTLQVLLNRDLLKAVDERLSSSREEIESARKLNARGLVLGSDYYAAQAILGGLEIQKAQLEKSFEAAKERLAILTGEPAMDANLSLIHI